MVSLFGTGTSVGRCWASAAVICLCAAVIPRIADAADPEAPKVLYWRSSDARDLDENLIRYLKAHLASDFQVLVVNAPRGGTEELRDMIQIHDAVAAVRLSADRNGVSVTAPEISMTPWFIAVTGEVPGSANWCESVAVLILSDIASLVPPPSVVPPVPEPVSPVPKIVPGVPPPPPLNPSVSIVSGRVNRASQPRRFLPVRLGGAVGYAPARQISDRAMLHGAEINVEVDFGSYLRIALQSDVAQKEDIVLGNRDVTLRRFPLRALLYGSLPVKSFVLAVGAGFVWAPTYVRDLPYAPADSETGRVQHPRGGAVQFLAEYWIVSRFGIRCAGGVDMFTDEIRLTYEEAVVLRVNRVGAVMFFGVTGRFVVSGDRVR